MPDSGDIFNLTVTNNGVPEQQTWEIPSRSSCLACHTPVGGIALTFNTREMNKNNPMNGVAGNQIATMSAAGYFSAPVPSPNALPAFARGDGHQFQPGIPGAVLSLGQLRAMPSTGRGRTRPGTRGRS